MPELPEVECVRRGLSRANLTDPISEVWRSEKDLRTGATWRDEQLSRLQGARGRRWRRRGKFLLWELDGQGQSEPLGLLVHLGMTGALRVHHTGESHVLHTHVIFRFGDARELRFVDPRRFGGMRAGSLVELEQRPPLAELGPEPLGRGFSGSVLAERAGRSKRVLRDVLLDQRVVAGVGNIYALEALFLAGLHPLVVADRLAPSAWDRLAQAVVAVLRQGIRNGGTTFRDFQTVSGKPGGNQRALAVYGRAGTPCTRCGRLLRPFVHGGRSGAFCPVDQPKPRARRIL